MVNRPEPGPAIALGGEHTDANGYCADVPSGHGARLQISALKNPTQPEASWLSCVHDCAAP
jgi:hypothetical protein